MAPVRRPRFLRFLEVTLFLCLSHTPVFTVFFVHAILKFFMLRHQKCCRRAYFFWNLVFYHSETVIFCKKWRSKTLPSVRFPSASVFFRLCWVQMVTSSNQVLCWLWTWELLTFPKHRMLHCRVCIPSTTSIHSAASANEVTLLKAFEYWNLRSTPPMLKRSIDTEGTWHER